MAGRIPQHFIDDLLHRVDIVSLVDERVPLRKAGRDYQARCPFHEEKTPSFTVSPSKQFYYCFGCGAHGSALHFLMEYDRLEFLDAVEALAGTVGIEVPRGLSRDDGKRQQRDTQLALLENTARLYRRRLANERSAIDYLKSRGLDRESVNRYRLGYAPPGWQNLTGEIGDTQALVEAGLAVRRDDGGGCYDRFRHRIMFPIRDTRGRVIAFGGRMAPGGQQEGPKYLNSPETALFSKSNQLYGLFEARQAVRDLQRIIVVEGYMDVVALAQHGFANSVATLGTATTEAHLELLYRFTPSVIFCFDGDRAGRQAAWRALERALAVMREGREARFLFLPQGEDPDTVVRSRGEHGFRQLLDEATPLSRFLLDQLARQVDMASIDGRARLVELARPHVAKLKSGTFRILLLDDLAARVRMQRGDLESSLHSGRAPEPAGKTSSSKVSGTTPVRRAVQILLHRPDLASSVVEPPDELRRSHLPGVELLAEMIEFLLNCPHVTTAILVEHWREHEAGTHLARLAGTPLQIPDEGVEVELHDALARVGDARRRHRTEELLAQAGHGELSSEQKLELNELLLRK